MIRFQHHLGALGVSVALACGSPAFAQVADEETLKQAGVDVPAPKRTKSVAPIYPPEAQAQGLRGIVILELIVDTQGRVASAEVVRSVPPFDEAALAAVRQWEYEITKVDGKPVRVKMTVPISFTMRLPDVTRGEGIPELRQGAAPAYPAGAGGGASVTAQVTLDAEGRVAEAEVKSGGPPWDEALLRAMRTWRFIIPPGRGVLSFRVQADFIPAAQGQPPRVSLALSGLQESESFASASEPPGPPASPAPPASQGPPSSAPAAPEREASPTPPAPVTTASPSASAPEAQPQSAVEATTPGEPEASAEPATPTPTTTAAQPGASPAAEAVAGRPPPVEVISIPPPPAAAPAAPGASSLANVSLGIGVPDLVKGRRPVPPPLARMAAATGTVEVRFSVDASGQATVKSSSGPELLQAAAEDAVRTWSFRRTTAERLHLIALFNYGTDSASASVTIEP